MLPDPGTGPRGLRKHHDHSDSENSVILQVLQYHHRVQRRSAQLQAIQMAQRRLNRLLSELTEPPSVVGTLTLGDISFDIHASDTPSRLPHSENTLLDVQDSFNADNLHFMLQKYLLVQDIFLLSQPGPYARRLAMTFCRQVGVSLVS